MLIKILFEFTRFFKVQKFLKNRIHFNTSKSLEESLYLGEGGGGCNRAFIFLFTGVDGPKTWGLNKWGGAGGGGLR